MPIPITSTPPPAEKKETPPPGMLPLDSERNGVIKKLLPSPVTRGSGPTRWTYRPERPTMDNLDEWLKWCGADLVLSATFSKAQLAIQDIYYSATHDFSQVVNKGTPQEDYADKDFDEKEFLEGIASLSTRGEKLSDLEDRQQDFISDIIKRMSEPTLICLKFSWLVIGDCILLEMFSYISNENTRSYNKTPIWNFPLKKILFLFC